jgi:hypothetical protein
MGGYVGGIDIKDIVKYPDAREPDGGADEASNDKHYFLEHCFLVRLKKRRTAHSMPIVIPRHNRRYRGNASSISNSVLTRVSAQK